MKFADRKEFADRQIAQFPAEKTADATSIADALLHTASYDAAAVANAIRSGDAGALLSAITGALRAVDRLDYMQASRDGVENSGQRVAEMRRIRYAKLEAAHNA